MTKYHIPKSLLSHFGDILEEKLADDLDNILFQLFEENGISPNSSKELTIEIIVSQPESE